MFLYVLLVINRLLNGTLCSFVYLLVALLMELLFIYEFKALVVY